MKLKTIPVSENWRIIIRLSIDDDLSSLVRNAIQQHLENCGIKRTKTGTWQSEFPHCTSAAAAKQLGRVLKILSNPAQILGANPDAKLDHIWFYIERAL